MEINEVFKKYPENEPNFNSTNYLTIVKLNCGVCYAITFFNEEGEFELSGEEEEVLAFTERSPNFILNAL